MKTNTLVRPDLSFEHAFITAINDFRSNNETDIEALFDYCGQNFHKYIYMTQMLEAGKSILPGQVPYSTFWLINEDKQLIGFSNIRHYLTPASSIEGGHIGYSIRPSERKKGFGKLQLKLILKKCLQIGIKEVMITCDFDNIASAKIIEANHGIRVGEAISPRSKKLVFQYLIKI